MVTRGERQTIPRITPEASRDAAVRCAAAILAEAGAEEAALDARILFLEATGLDRARLLRDGDKPLGPRAAMRLDAMLARRLAGEPVWRILGRREFWGLNFEVTPAVLDPRPDTETLVRAALAAMAGRRDEPLRIADLGVGSAAILCALLTELPNACGLGIDRSLAACTVARGNVARLGLDSRALIANADWGDALRPGAFDLVVSNPPYVETDVIPTLDPAVRNHDPHEALDGGTDGLSCYRAIVADLPRLLVHGGVAALEVGAGQATDVGALLTDVGLSIGAVHRDLGGHERALVATRSS